MFEKRKADDAVVRALVLQQRSCAKLRGACVCAVCSRRVEDFVDTGILARQSGNSHLSLTMVSRRLVAGLLP